METTRERSFCRLCPGYCGVELSIDRLRGRIEKIVGDHDHRQTMGFACIKGLVAEEAHHGPQRLLRPLKRNADGSFSEIALEQALDEIAERLRAIIATHGADAVAGYRGTLNYLHTTANHMLSDWLRSLGSRSLYSTISIDQSAKWVAAERLGTWAAGTQNFESSDVMMVFGSNPFVTMTTPTFPTRNPQIRLRRGKQRGVKLIVVDPRRTETAKQADLVLQLLPGEDVAVAAGMLRVILSEGLHDQGFCTRWVNGLEDLRLAVEPFEPEYVATRAGVPVADLRAAARMFANARRGTAVTGTGPDMGPHSNLAEHLIQALNVVCGRFPRAGEAVPNPGVIGSRLRKTAQAISPSRGFESSPRGARGIGMLFGERITANLVHDITEPRDGQVRALFVLGGNPAGAIPDTRRTARALSSLDLLVAVEPHMTETARLSHYILPPRLQYERSDITSRIFEGSMFEEPFAQYTPRLLDDPPRSDLCEDWFPLWAVMARLDRTITLDGVELGRSNPPSNDDLIRILARNGAVPIDEVMAVPGGKVFEIPPQFVEEAEADSTGRFELLPDDV
ncbi:MAG: molybdopterin-dependent oxidoreductase, partial [Burkholderia sp.]|nr:molybdopterin-dependent oxidoreductase [Burkholderia sp.]